MLIEFTVGNHLSFKDKKTLSLEASSIKEFEENTFKAGNYNLLKSVVIYGANSSGKSNLIKSLAAMKNIVSESAKMSSADKINVKPFLLNTETENRPSYFEILILIDDIRYRYGFEADEDIIHAEWLFRRKSKTESLLFIRDKDKIEITKEFNEGDGIVERTRDNALFLSVCDQWNGEVSKKIMNWFTREFYYFSGLVHSNTRSLTVELNNTPELGNRIDDFLSQFDLGFSKFKIESNVNKDENTVHTYHNKYDHNGNIIGNHWFELSKQESSGTNKIFDIAGYILLSLQAGITIVIDELDAKLHPLLTMAIVKLFNSFEHNPKNAQLIFATHDTNLLSYGEFRRDQIYFTEKNQYEETDLYSLVEYKDDNGVKPRNDRSFEKDYINGRYGAIPFIGDFSNLLSNGQAIEA
jgi:AAA15 family ATPase/GTPase